MDQLIDLNVFPILNAAKTQENVIKSIRLLSVFGERGNEVIFATNEDIVYGFGCNMNGCLGLGHWHRNITEPVMNKVLSHKQLMSITIGYNHYLALTLSGHVYAWGQNNFGELGLGNRGNKNGTSWPTLIRELVGMKVVQICCGSSYSLALTTYGQVYAWGRNSYNQLGVGFSSDCLWIPRKVVIKDKIVSISCGRIHSMAVAKNGRLYMWGVIKCHRNGLIDLNGNNESITPSSHQNMDNKSIVKAVCGPSHALILASDGSIYAFGHNFDGQVGKGSFGDPKTAIRIGENIKFKDIIANSSIHLSIGISEDNHYYVWGFADNTKVFSPKRVEKSFRSVYDVFTHFSRSKITFETIVIRDNSLNTNECPFSKSAKTEDITQWMKTSINDLNQPNGPQNSVPLKNDITITKNFENGESSAVRSPPKSPPKTDSNNCSDESFIDNHQSVITQTSEPFSEKVFQNILIKSFNNPEDHDLRLIFKDKSIYCHKTILKFRNNRFWQKCKNQFKNGHKNEIRIKGFYYNSFIAFIGHLYGLTPELNCEESCIELLRMANIFDEPELKDLCSEFLSTRISITNVCPLYERAVETKSLILSNSCIDFVSKNSQQVFNSEAFLTMDGFTSDQLINNINKQ